MPSVFESGEKLNRSTLSSINSHAHQKLSSPEILLIRYHRRSRFELSVWVFDDER